MAPERVGLDPVNDGGDNREPCVMLHELLAARLTVTGTLMVDMLASIEKNSPPPFHDAALAIAANKATPVMRMMAQTAAERQSSARSFAGDFAAIKWQIETCEQHPRRPSPSVRQRS